MMKKIFLKWFAELAQHVLRTTAIAGLILSEEGGVK
jgi:hypothetical protein